MHIAQDIFTITKVVSMAGLIVAGLLFGFNAHTLQTNFHMPVVSGFETINIMAVAIVGALFASITWNNITFIAGEVKHPQKNIPKAMICGVTLVVSLYLLMNMIYLGVLPFDAIQNAPQDIVAARTMSEIFGTIGRDIIAVIIMISAFGCANGMILTGSRVYYKMAKDTERIILQNDSFFNRLSSVDRVIVIGHSYNEIDIPYYCKIVGSVRKNAKWELNVYSENDCKRAKDLIRQLNLKEDQWNIRKCQ